MYFLLQKLSIILLFSAPTKWNQAIIDKSVLRAKTDVQDQTRREKG